MIDTVVQESWTRMRETLKARVSDRVFGMWFERSSILGLKRGVLSIGVPNIFIRDWVEEHYGDLLAHLAAEALGTSVRVQVKVDPELFKQMQSTNTAIEEAVEPLAEEGDPRTIDSFLETPGNALAVKAVRHAAAGAEPIMNPLVIVGGEGTGKSHLAAALAALHERGTPIFRTTGQQFADRFTMNLKTRRLEAFRDQICAAQTVIVDDVQELAGKTVTQRELAQLFQDLTARGGRMVLFVDRHPRELKDFGEELLSVLTSGMLVEIEAPDEAAKVEVLKSVLASAKRRIPSSVIETVVRRVGGSVTRLDRLVRKVYAFAGLSGCPVDDRFLDEHLDEIAGPQDPTERRVELIFSLIEEHFDLDRDDLLSKRKTKALSDPRGLIVYLLREHVGLTYKEIGRRLGDRSHTSVFLMYKKISEALNERADYRALMLDAGRRLISAA